MGRAARRQLEQKWYVMYSGDSWESSSITISKQDGGRKSHGRIRQEPGMGRSTRTPAGTGLSMEGTGKHLGCDSI